MWGQTSTSLSRGCKEDLFDEESHEGFEIDHQMRPRLEAYQQSDVTGIKCVGMFPHSQESGTK